MVVRGHIQLSQTLSDVKIESRAMQSRQQPYALLSDRDSVNGISAGLKQ